MSVECLLQRFWVFPIIAVHRVQRASRDPQRSPMQWSDDINAGFNNKTNVTWLPLHPDYSHVNVEVQQNANI